MKPSTDPVPTAVGGTRGPGRALRRGRWACAVAGLALAVPLTGTAPQAVAVPAADSAPFTCSVRPGPFERCDRVYASPGETVTVSVNESGTVTRGDFEAVARGTGDVLGTVRDVTPSSGDVVLWRNDTDRMVIVEFNATSADRGGINGMLVSAP
ncbi:hypothetical protein ABZZ17_30390 [Streptomyces sp. NPDC006512]|uniref:hypothetical protein n=1 Tax=Streptomyces sp. NPDC006512 TaxID=3154307 RepID=UPI0033A02989